MGPDSKVVVLGARGMLGADVVRAFSDECELHAFGSGDLDVTSGPALVKKIVEIRPEWVLNCAAYTDVDGAEKHQDEAMRVLNVVQEFLDEPWNRSRLDRMRLSVEDYWAVCS